MFGSKTDSTASGEDNELASSSQDNLALLSDIFWVTAVIICRMNQLEDTWRNNVVSRAELSASVATGGRLETTWHSNFH
jgi:hypothetical protein